MEGVTTLAQAQAANEQLKQGIEERNRQAIAAWEARTGLKYDPEWREHIVRPDGPFREVDGSIVREGTLRNGEWDGEVREYNGDRLTRSVVYKNGVQTGSSKEYRFDGTLAVERVPGEDGQSVTEIHYDASGKTENYRLVRGKRGVVLFDSRNQPQEQPQEAPAEPEVAGLLTGPTELEVEPEATEEQPSTAMDAQEALNRAGERFRNRRAAEALAQDTALPETGAEGESDLDGLAGNTAMSVTIREQYDPNGWGDLGRKVNVVGDGKPFYKRPAPKGKRKTQIKDIKEEVMRLAFENVSEQPNVVMKKLDGDKNDRFFLAIDGVLHQIAKGRLFHSANSADEATIDAVTRIGDLFNASVEVPGNFGDMHYRVAAMRLDDSYFVLFTERDLGGEMEVRDVQILKSVSAKKAGAPTQVVTPRELPANAISIANLKEAWESIFLSGMEQHLKQKEAKPGNTAMSVGGFGLNANARAEMEKVRKQYEGTDKWMKAPNGKPTKLTRRLWLLVRTPAFKRWFGDWENDPANASKVVDENGEPLVVYHGSENAGFTTFDSDYWDEDAIGNFASSEEEIAGTYSGTSLLIRSDMGQGKRQGNYALFLNIRNPLIVDAQGNYWDEIPPENRDDYVGAGELTDEQLETLAERAGVDEELERDEDGELTWQGRNDLVESVESAYAQDVYDSDGWPTGETESPIFNSETLEATSEHRIADSTRKIANRALKDGTGYDGVIFRDIVDIGPHSRPFFRRESDVFVTKEGPQLKSAVRNTGNFDPENPDIRFSVGSRMGRWDDKRVGTIDRINREALKRDLEMPVPFAGSKRTILNEHPEFFKAVGEAAIRNGGKVIDAFAGAGTYTAGLGQLGALPKGSVLNEWSAARYVMHKMLAERTEAMARAAEKLVTRFANSPEVAEVRRRVAQANKDGQHVVNINQPVIDWFYDELNGKHGTVYVDGTGNTEYGDAALRATPESAALYHVLQSIMSGGFPVNFVWKKGELKIDVAGGNFRSGQVGRIAEKNAKTNVWRIGVSVFNPEHYTKRIRETGRIYREAGVKVTRGDGWALVKTAKRGDVVFVDPAYLGTQSYGGKKNVDANDANDPEIAIGRLVDLVNWADANGVSVVYTNEFSDKSAMGGMSQEDYARVWEEARDRIGADKMRVGYVERGAQGFGKRGGGRADVIFVSGAAMAALDKATGNTALSVGSRPGRAPTVEPGGDVREAGEGALAWLRRKFVHSQTPVFDAVRRVMGVGREPPDALNVEAAAKNVHGKIRARQEMLQRAYLEPLKAILAQPGLDRKRFDDYALALHALERNRMIQERSVVVDPTTGEVVDLGVEAGSGVTNAWAERVIREIQRDPFAEQYKEAANILAEMNRFVLRGSVADGLLTEAQAKTWMRLSPHYVPLKSGGAAPGAIHKRATGRFTRPDSVLVNSMRQAYATVRNGELNRVNKTMADWIREYDPNGEQVGGTVPESHKHAKIKMADPQYVPKGSTAEALLRERGIRLVETEDKGGYWVDTGVLPNALKRVVRESVPQGDDIVTFWENGERKFIRFEGKRGRDGRAENEAARIADALNFKNVLHKEGKFWDAIRGLTRWKANVSTSWNPTFIVRNMGADVFNTANLMMIEGKYAELARTMRNYPEALRTIARLHSLRREAGDSKMERMFARCFCALFCWLLCADCAPLTCLPFFALCYNCAVFQEKLQRMKKRWKIRAMNGCGRLGKVVAGGLGGLVSSRRGGTLLLAFPVGMDLYYNATRKQKGSR